MGINLADIVVGYMQSTFTNCYLSNGGGAAVPVRVIPVQPSIGSVCTKPVDSLFIICKNLALVRVPKVRNSRAAVAKANNANCTCRRCKRTELMERNSSIQWE